MIETLAAEVPAMDRAIFNLHVPPYDSELDIAPSWIPTSGSRPPAASRRRPGGIDRGSGSDRAASAASRFHGHIHESKGARRIGRTLCINPDRATRLDSSTA